MFSKNFSENRINFSAKNKNKQFDWKQPVQIYSFFLALFSASNLISLASRNFFTVFIGVEKNIIINIWTLKHGWNEKKEKMPHMMTLIKSVVEFCIRCTCTVCPWTNSDSSKTIREKSALKCNL